MGNTRTRRVDFESYMNEMARINRQMVCGEIDEVAYRSGVEGVERRYAERLYKEDCREFASAEEYHDALAFMAELSPEHNDDFKNAYKHENEHARALTGSNVDTRYGFWLLREEDGAVSLWPYIRIEAPNTERYINARTTCVSAPAELSPYDIIESSDSNES